MDQIKKRLRQGLQIKQTVLLEGFEGLAKMAEYLLKAISKKRQIFILGEGIAHSLAEILASRLFVAALPKSPRIQLLGGPATLSSLGYEQIFPGQVEAHLKEGDVLLLLCLQGQERYLIKSVEKAKAQKGYTLLISSNKQNFPSKLINFGVAIPTEREEELLELHLTIGNALCEIVRERLAGPSKSRSSSTSLPKAKKSKTAKVSKPKTTADQFVRFSCQNCGEIIFTEKRFAGKKGTCPNCNKKLRVPQSSTVSQEEMKGNEKRLHVRFKVQDCLVAYSPKKFPDSVSEFTSHAVLEDLSEGGCAFLVEARDKWSLAEKLIFQEGDSLYLLLSIPAFNQPLRLKGEVRRIQPVKGKAACKVGVKFKDLSPEDRERLKKLASSDVLRNLRRASGLF